MADDTHRYYRHSGAVPAAALVSMPASAVVAGLVVGKLYGFADYWIPWIYITFVLALLTGAGVGAGVGAIPDAPQEGFPSHR